MLSPCVKSGQLSCLHCHTSSGRYKFKDEAKANQACLPCHQQRVDQAAAHIRHDLNKPGTPGKCISCHMPMTEFARMQRSDHSMLPPTPAATRKFKSPNACNLCHQDKDAAWADKQVRQWHKKDYQAPVLHRAGLIDAARRRDWTRLPEMLTYITDKNHDPVFATSLIRLLSCLPGSPEVAGSANSRQSRFSPGAGRGGGGSGNCTRRRKPNRPCWPPWTTATGWCGSGPPTPWRPIPRGY